MPTTKEVMKKYGKCGAKTTKRGATVRCHKDHGHDGRHQGKLPPATLGTIVNWEDTDE